MLLSDKIILVTAAPKASVLASLAPPPARVPSSW